VHDLFAPVPIDWTAIRSDRMAIGNPRMTPEHKKPGVAFWATVVACIVVLYLLTFGPACWMTSWGILSHSVTAHTFYPVVWTSAYAPRPIQMAIGWYAELGAGQPWHVLQLQRDVGVFD
jgi:hypothetical protein